MSTILNSFSRTASVRNTLSSSGNASSPTASSPIGVRGLSVMLLAAAVSALVVFADQYFSVWTDGRLFFGWVVLWVVVFAGLALFAGTARNLATRAMGVLDGWSQSLANSRADARMWEIAQNDPRVMSELMTARTRGQDAKLDVDFDAALAPMGFEAPVAEVTVTNWVRFSERLSASQARRAHLYYI